MKSIRLLCLLLALVLIAVGCKKKPTETTTREKLEEATILLFQAAEEGNIKRMKSLIARGSDINAGDQYGTTPLHLAVYFDHKGVVELLLAEGADVNARGHPNAVTPLYNATVNVAELLITQGANVNAKSKYGKTPLHSAALRGHKGMVELLIANGADVNATDDGGRTPLDEAARRRHEDIVELLRKHGATD